MEKMKDLIRQYIKNDKGFNSFYGDENVPYNVGEMLTLWKEVKKDIVKEDLVNIIGKYSILEDRGNVLICTKENKKSHLIVFYSGHEIIRILKQIDSNRNYSWLINGQPSKNMETIYINKDF